MLPSEVISLLNKIINLLKHGTSCLNIKKLCIYGFCKILRKIELSFAKISLTNLFL